MTVIDRVLTGHRALLADADRLAVLAERLAGAAALEPLHATAAARAVDGWTDAVREHHTAVDELLPVDLRADLGPALDRLQRAAAALAVRADDEIAAALAVELAELRGVLREHVDDAQAVLLARAVPAVSRPGR